MDLELIFTRTKTERWKVENERWKAYLMTETDRKDD